MTLVDRLAILRSLTIISLTLFVSILEQLTLPSGTLCRVAALKTPVSILKTPQRDRPETFSGGSSGVCIRHGSARQWD